MADRAAITALYTESVRAGIDPTLAVATAGVESDLNPRAVGDFGTSFGLFQLHRGGLLGNLTPTQAFDPVTNARRALGNMRATAFKTRYTDAGELAAASQRPADRAGYARKVNARLADADKILSGAGLPTDLPTNSGARPSPGVAGDVDPGRGDAGGSWWKSIPHDAVAAIPGAGPAIAGAGSILDVLPGGNPLNAITDPIERAAAQLAGSITAPFTIVWGFLSDPDTWTRVGLFLGGAVLIIGGAFIAIRG